MSVTRTTTLSPLTLARAKLTTVCFTASTHW